MTKEAERKSVLMRIPYIRNLVKQEASASAKRSIAVIAPSLGGRPQPLPVDFQTLAKEGYEQNEIVFACMNERSGAVKKASLKLYEADGSEVQKHELRKLLSRPNPFTSEKDYNEKIELDLCAAGNAFGHKVRSRSGQVVELWNRDPDKVRPVPDPYNFISHWEIKVGSTWHPVPAEDVIHYKYANLRNSYFGLSPLMVAALKVDIDTEMSKYVRHILKNMAVISGVFVAEGEMGDDAYRRAKGELTELYSGAVNAGKTFLIEGGAKYQKIGLDLNELNFGDLELLIETRICMAFQVSPILVGAKIGLERSKYDNYEAAQQSLYDEVVSGEWELIASKTQHSLFPDFDLDPDSYYLAYDTSKIQALQEDTDKLFERQKNAADILTIDQRRAIIGEEPLPKGKGDKIVVTGKQGVSVIYSSDPADIPQGQAAPAAAAKALLSFKAWLKAAEKKELSKEDTELVDAVQGIQEAYYPLLYGQARNLFQTVAEDYRQVLDESQVKALTNEEAEGLFDRLEALNEKRKAHYARQLSFDEVLRAAAVEAGKMVGIDFDIDAPDVQRFLSDYPFKFAEAMGEASVDKIRFIVAYSEREGWTMSTLREALEKEFDDWTSLRAERVARTETIRATNAGARASYRQAGAKALKWVVTEDDRLCPYCATMKDVTVAADASFFKVGDEIEVEGEGKLKIDYEDIEHPPLHPHCRCALTAVF